MAEQRKMDKRILEWLKQADYDMDTVDFMCKGGRYFYAVFMCQLSFALFQNVNKGKITYKLLL